MTSIDINHDASFEQKLLNIIDPDILNYHWHMYSRQ